MSDNLDKREGFDQSELVWNESKDPNFIDLKSGAFNSNAFLLLAPIRLEEAIRDGTSLSLVFLDVNNMGRLNTKYGHQEVDGMLAGFVRDLKEKLRKVDSIFRWGGDEFLLLLRETGLEGAEKLVLPRINEAATKNKLSFSIGLSVNQAGDSIEDMIRRADVAMYRNKEGSQG